MKKSILIKIFGGYVVLLVLFSVIFSVLSFRTMKKHHLDTLAQDLENLGHVLENRLVTDLQENRRSELAFYLQELGKKTNVRFTVVDADGVVLAESELDPSKMDSHRFRPEIQEALQGRRGRALRFSSTIKEEMLYVALPLWLNGRIIGAIRLSLFVPEIKALLTEVQADILRAVVFLMAASLLAAFLFSRHLTRPLKSLVQASERVASGDFETAVRLRETDEWQELGRSFNAMTTELKAVFADLKRRKEELDLIIASMQEGVLFLDRQGKIVLANESMKKLLGQEAPQGKYFWEVIRLTPFVELVRNVREGKRGLTADLNWGAKRILCQASYLPLQDGVVVTFSDVSEAYRLAQIKKDFVLNVSHELRTPLTAIRGYAETLEAEVSAEQKTYVETILRHTDRLNKIVADLLTLSSLEEKGAELEVQEVRLPELAEAILKIFESKAKDKNLTLRLTADQSLPAIQADPFRLEQVLVNLVDNAVKYTEKGSVEVRLKKAAGEVVIEVADTGIGIPAEARERVFERFYVVDKSRSRNLGGTGLGLSIVKHIVVQHGGRIELDSTPGAGSVFRVFLPVKRA